MTASGSGANVLQQVDDESGPQQRQRDAVGQELGVEIDHRQREQRPQQPAGGDTLRRRAEVPDGARGEHAAQDLDDRVTARNRRLAAGAAAPQREPRDDRDVLQRRDAEPRTRDTRSAGRPGCRPGRARESRRAARRIAPASRARASSAADGSRRSGNCRRKARPWRPPPLQTGSTRKPHRRLRRRRSVAAGASPAPEGRRGRGRAHLAGRARQTTEPSLKIGRYIATTRPPITTPRNTMMIGSSRLESAATASSTSRS